MQPVWKIEMLGTLRAIGGDQTVTRFRTRRVASLLAYLALHRNQVLSRDTLSDLLWPDIHFEVARRNLRQALYALRQVLEPDEAFTGQVLLSINDGVQLNPQAVTTDVADFERATEEGRRTGSLSFLRDAVHLYKGPLLPGLADNWIIDEQMRLEDLYLYALGELGAREEDSMAAIGHLRTALKLDPLTEKWHMALVARYLDLGQPNRAMDQFLDLERILFEEFQRKPSPASQQVKLRIAKALEAQPLESFNPDPTSAAKRIVSLPTVVNRYFGRQREIATVCNFLESGRSRMVTVLGPAGVGKTRLALECGHAIAARQSWNVVFVPLADRLNAAEIFEAIAGALEAGNIAPGSEISAIVRQTEDRPTLLILDNLEQIATEAGEYVSKLLAAGKNLICLGTSRHSLQIQEEQLVNLETLPLPSAEEHSTEALEAIPSVQLFLDRCQALRPDLVLNEENAEAIAELCIRFDGLPLAIEIAAGLSNTFSPTQMARGLPQTQTEIVNRRRDAPERHRTLKAAIDWSFISLPEELHRLFLSLCVFRGSFNLKAANEVCFENRDGIVNAVNSLIERSLIRRHGSQEMGEPRFELLTAFREHAENESSLADLANLRESHAEFFARQTPPDRPFVSVDEQTTVHLEIEEDYENFLAAIEHSLAKEDLDRCVRLLSILSTRWLTRGPKVAERELIRRLNQKSGIDQISPSLRIRLLRMMGTTYIRSAEYQAAYECCQTALQIAEAANDPELLATCYSALSVCAGYLGQLENCLQFSEKVLEIVGDENLVLAERSHLGIGSVLWDQGRLQEANREFILARRLSEKLRGGEPDALIVINQAEIALGLSHVEGASRFAHEAIRISKRLRDDFTLAMALSIVGRCQIREGKLEAAAATNLEALERFRKGDFVFWTLKCLRNHALVLTHQGRLAEAATLMSVTGEVASGQKAAEAKEESAALETIRAGLPPEAFEAAWAKGLAMSAEEAFQFLSDLVAA